MSRMLVAGRMAGSWTVGRWDGGGDLRRPLQKNKDCTSPAQFTLFGGLGDYDGLRDYDEVFIDL